jgi:hypothetical protein
MEKSLPFPQGFYGVVQLPPIRPKGHGMWTVKGRLWLTLSPGSLICP